VKLPNAENAVILEAKLVNYVLSPWHPLGHHKAEFFRRFGFSVAAWQKLAQALLKHAAQHEVTKVEDSPFGRRYIVEGEVMAPDGRLPLIRAVWFVESGEDVPRLVTAYPLEKS
jgi:hypothetical protein